ncbi:hypothetical protein PILCRDRAFT_821832 [Piloderma croceum F 1598]|uniref:Uncharacterized protein n=1 Tax=Piloderma croceum (strain F 1598) TaxID=765440 RepID=A0A0C3FMH2_PILCF|nr:hypothetical protein PILCRDRAFT_821832 [Piloderma croceum F 1598]
MGGLSPTIISSASPGGGTSPKIPSPTTTGSIAPVTGAIKSGISKGGVAAVVIVLLFFLGGFIVYGLRRRSRARRAERRNQWFGAAAYGSTVNGAPGTSPTPSSVNGHSGRATVASRTASIRSSFGTTIDHGMAFRVDTPVTTPPFNLSAMSPAFPPMAEIKSVVKDPQPGSGASTRFSNGSNHSVVSQYLDVPGLPALPPGATTPMSVRPFSPSESFMFPKPPHDQVNDNETDWLSRSPTSGITDSGRTLTSSPPNGNIAGSSNTKPLANLAANPFSDPAFDATNLNTEFASVELIRRPFVPTLDDELAVTPGDSVRVVKVFDDGWAYVEKVGSTGARGLIPIDCMRDSGEDLPAFLASKRISSYYGTDEIVMGKALGSAV